MKKTVMRKYAQLAVRRGAHVKKGQGCGIYAQGEQHEFAQLVAEEAYRAGAKWVEMRWEDQVCTKLKYRHETLTQLSQVAEWEKARMQHYVEMLLCKSFWVFRGAWKGCVVFLCCLTAAMCAMEFDITGFEGRVPDAAEVQSAHLSGMESAPYDDLGYATLTLDTPEELEALTGLHQSIVAHKEELEEADWESTWSEDGSGLSIQSDGWTYVDISYTLMDGSYLTRKYRVPLSQSELDTPGTPAARLDALLNAPGLAGESYFHAQREGDRLVRSVVQ